VLNILNWAEHYAPYVVMGGLWLASLAAVTVSVRAWKQHAD
jgi:hypothetical protein